MRGSLRRRTKNPSGNRRPVEVRREICQRSLVSWSVSPFGPSRMAVVAWHGGVIGRHCFCLANSLPIGVCRIRGDARMCAHHRATVTPHRSGRCSRFGTEDAEASRSFSSRLRVSSDGWHFASRWRYQYSVNHDNWLGGYLCFSCRRRPRSSLLVVYRCEAALSPRSSWMVAPSTVSSCAGS